MIVGVTSNLYRLYEIIFHHWTRFEVFDRFGLFGTWLLAARGSTAVAEEMTRLHQIRSSAGTSGAAMRGRRQQGESLFSVLWASLDDLRVLEWARRSKEAPYTQTVSITGTCAGLGSEKGVLCNPNPYRTGIRGHSVSLPPFH